MGHESVDGFQETEKPNLGCATDEENVDNSRESNGVSVSETVIGIPKEFPISAVVVIDSENPLTETGENAKVSERNNEGKSWVVDLKCGDEETWEGERVCRICLLDSGQELKASSMEKTELIRLGCGCNGELSVAHPCCAEAWFKFKGNRICEICGETVDNIRGVGNETFMEEWLENGGHGNAPNSTERSQGCWQGQTFCNFLMACLVIAFVVPWFFRINMF